MRILFSIFINAFILYAITYLLGANPEKSIEAGILLWCDTCGYTSFEALKTYIIGGLILGWINVTIRPLLKILALPLYLVFFGFVSFVVNALILKLFTFIINDILLIPWVGYTINGWVNFAVAVAIFTILNMVYSLLFFKK